MTDVMMENGEILSREKIDKLVIYIINKFADEKLSVCEAKIILDETKERVEGLSEVKAINF